MQARLVLLGTGASSCVPYLQCLAGTEESCDVCLEACRNPESKVCFVVIVSSQCKKKKKIKHVTENEFNFDLFSVHFIDELN